MIVLSRTLCLTLFLTVGPTAKSDESRNPSNPDSIRAYFETADVKTRLLTRQENTPIVNIDSERACLDALTRKDNDRILVVYTFHNFDYTDPEI